MMASPSTNIPLAAFVSREGYFLCYDSCMIATSLFGYSYPIITGILAGIVASGGTYGPYGVVNIARGQDYKADTVRMATVLDGDTFTLENGNLVRLAEIDAPEKGTCGADEATTALTKLLTGKALRLIKDTSGQDDFGRLIRIVQVDSEDPRTDNITAQESLVKNGYARAMPGENVRYQEKIALAELHAQSRLLGLWGMCAKDNAKKAAAAHADKVDEHALPTDPKCLIKGNISEGRFGKKYTLPTCRDYDRIKVSPKKGEGYFCSEKEAQKAGFTKSGVCN
jgi:endonuclease YncB( thermonuclease family)